MRASILQICAESTTLERFLRPLLPPLVAAGYRVEVMCGDADKLGAGWPEEINLHIVPVSRTFDPVAAWRTVQGYRGVIRRGGFDLVHAQTSIAGLLGCLAARMAGTRHVLYTQHGFYCHDHQSAPARGFWRWFESLAIRLCDLLICVSPAEMEQAHTAYPRLRPKLLLAPGPGIDTEPFTAVRLRRDEVRRQKRLELGIPSEAEVVLMIARPRVDKGYPELFEAFAEVVRRRQQTHLLVAGYGPGENPFQRDLERLELTPRVKLLGWRQDVPELMAAADVFTLPSWHEGFATSVAEALIAGTPVVGTDIPGIRFHVREGLDGYLVPVDNPPRLAEALCSALAMRDRLSQHVLERSDALATAYDTQTVARWYVDLYSRLLQ